MLMTLDHLLAHLGSRFNNLMKIDYYIYYNITKAGAYNKYKSVNTNLNTKFHFAEHSFSKDIPISQTVCSYRPVFIELTELFQSVCYKSPKHSPGVEGHKYITPTP